MATLTIRNLDDELKSRLQLEADSNGHSIEEQVHVILKQALPEKQPPQENLADRILRRFSLLNADDIPLQPRHDKPRAAKLKK
jgi:plasmid stability protein